MLMYVLYYRGAPIAMIFTDIPIAKFVKPWPVVLICKTGCVKYLLM